MAIGDVIKKYRKNKGMTQEEMKKPMVGIVSSYNEIGIVNALLIARYGCAVLEIGERSRT